MTQAQQDQKTAQERLNEGFQGLQEMEANRQRRRKATEDRIAEIKRQLQNIGNQRESAELVGDEKQADKYKQQIDKLKGELRDLEDKLALFQPETHQELYRKFKETPGQHKDYAKQVDAAGLEVLNDLQDQLDAKQQELQDLADEYQKKVDELWKLSHQAGNTSHTVNHARKFLTKDELVPKSSHRFRASHVESNWEITGEKFKNLIPGTDVN